MLRLDDVLYPTPKERAVELVEGGPKFFAQLQEPPRLQNPTSGQQSEQLPTYNAYTKDGDVTASPVCVNYGIPEDYEQLDRMGIVFQATDDPQKPLTIPVVETVPPYLNFAPLDNASGALTRSAAGYRKAFEQINLNGGGALIATSLVEVNKLLMESERKLLNAEGLPNRPWFKHQIHAPGFDTGDAAKTDAGGARSDRTKTMETGGRWDCGRGSRVAG